MKENRRCIEGKILRGGAITPRERTDLPVWQIAGIQTHLWGLSVQVVEEAATLVDDGHEAASGGVIF